MVLRSFIVLFIGLCTSVNVAASKDNWDIFGYQESPQEALEQLPHWVNLLSRHEKEDIPDGNCKSSLFNQCHFAEWLTFLDGIERLSPLEQVDEINRYANNKTYILDVDNYGLSDYWATAKQFLHNGGDCEDYAFTKLLSLKYLGFDVNDMRIVVLQDINLGIAHAVLALKKNGRILILDNQVEEVLSHRGIVHYIPLYSVNESRWWIHTPPR